MFVEHSMNGEGGQGPGAVASGRSGTAAEQRDEAGDDQGDSDQAGGDPPAVHPKQVAAQQDPAERRHRPVELAEHDPAHQQDDASDEEGDPGGGSIHGALIARLERGRESIGEKS